jgi:hypothetical protein
MGWYIVTFLFGVSWGYKWAQDVEDDGPGPVVRFMRRHFHSN